MRKFLNETELAENEYVLKIDERYNGKIGFLTKLNKGNKLPPKLFLDWGGTRWEKVELETWIVEQNLCKGWQVADDYRRGESQDWIVVIHPDGYKLEITTCNFMELLQGISVIKGKITQALRWDNGKLNLK